MLILCRHLISKRDSSHSKHQCLSINQCKGNNRVRSNLSRTSHLRTTIRQISILTQILVVEAIIRVATITSIGTIIIAGTSTSKTCHHHTVLMVSNKIWCRNHLSRCKIRALSLLSKLGNHSNLLKTLCHSIRTRIKQLKCLCLIKLLHSLTTTMQIKRQKRATHLLVSQVLAPLSSQLTKANEMRVTLVDDSAINIAGQWKDLLWEINNHISHSVYIWSRLTTYLWRRLRKCQKGMSCHLCLVLRLVVRRHLSANSTKCRVRFLCSRSAHRQCLILQKSFVWLSLFIEINY